MSAHLRAQGRRAAGVAAASLAAAAWGAPLSAQGAGAPPQLPEPAGVVVVEHAVRPTGPAAGEPVEERLVLRAPPGMRPRASDAGPPGEGVERLGRWRSEVVGDEGGAVTWILTAPLVAWRPGARRGPPVTVAAQGEGAEATLPLRLPGAPFQARPAEPGEHGATTPAPAEDAAPLREGLASLPVPLLLLVAVGGVWAGWGLAGGRTGGAAGPDAGLAGPVEAAPTARESPGPGPLAALGGGDDPARAALVLAAAVRTHPRVADRGVTPAHTTAEALSLGVPREVEGALRLADAVKYGGYAPTHEEVTAAARLAGSGLDRPRGAPPPGRGGADRA